METWKATADRDITDIKRMMTDIMQQLKRLEHSKRMGKKNPELKLENIPLPQCQDVIPSYIALSLIMRKTDLAL